MASLDDAIERSSVLANRIRQRTDLALRAWLEGYEGELDFSALDELMISAGAWAQVQTLGLDPQLVFAHPQVLQQYPPTSAYYRGLALLPQKRVAELSVGVASWEDPDKTPRVDQERATSVATLYNTVISSIIEGTSEWTLENGYRNILANMGIGLDGTIRNLIGRDAEAVVKGRIAQWLERERLISEYAPDQTAFELPNDYSMHFASEPDIEFRRTVNETATVVATIEIKGGRDPAGALERLGAIQKSFEATPPGCVNMLVAGVVTAEMADRLDKLGIVKRFLLDDLTADADGWFDFVNELFHHTVRITPFPVSGSTQER